MKTKKIFRNRSHKLKGGNKYKVTLDKLTLEQICNQAGFNLPNNEIQTQNNLDNLNKNSQDFFREVWYIK